MSCQLTIVAKPGYLHAVATGTNSPENVARYLGEVHRECAARVNASGDSMQFAETVATNRGLHVRVFPTVAAAEAWLRTLGGGAAET